ncbi:response regulator transcription factor [Pseudomonas sp. NPDC089569]|uniref:response regulator transcription factor n=1 Tax=Pseudomonas sp. NPDC089569 TaxID=3390722 RepID=UPI003D00B294
MTHVLVVEDDTATASEIEAALQDHGFKVTLASDGREGIIKALSSGFDLIVLDRMLPQVDGLGVLTSIRAAGNTTPVLVLSALGSLDERVRGLQAGGDDYLTKPFEFIELTARLDALLRRGQAQRPVEQNNQLKIGDLVIDQLRRTVQRGERKITLLPREYALLHYLAEHADEMVTRTMLFEAVWDYAYDERTNVIEVHIGRLRRKLDAEGETPLLQTIRGAGYVLRTPQ